ncbi:MAG: hypothetical protein JWO82_3063 [Akkermansiaceae bacterium]|nr:hypothetical protein [Akkermansiaceae bacterium]
MRDLSVGNLHEVPQDDPPVKVGQEGDFALPSPAFHSNARADLFRHLIPP